MIQEKYNRRIFDEGTEESIRTFSHLRSNVLSPVGITQGDDVLMLDPDSVSLVEWIAEQSASVTIGVSPDYDRSINELEILLPDTIDKAALDDINSTFNIIISLGALADTPASLKKRLSPQGRLVYAFPQKDRTASFTKNLLTEAGFDEITTYRVSPDYMYTTEIYAEDYLGGGAGDYLLIAR